MDSAITDSESELTALIRLHGTWCLVAAAIGVAIGIGAWFVLPKHYQTDALLRLEGPAQARQSTEQWVAWLYARDSSFESHATVDFEASELRRGFRSRATDEALYLRLSLQLTDAQKARQVLDAISQSLLAHDFAQQGGARVIAALPVETAVRPVAPRLPVWGFGGGAIGGFVGLLASLTRREKRTSR